MERKELVNEIIDFGIDYRIFNASMGRNELKTGIALILDDCAGVEDLINRIIVGVRTCEDLDTERLKALLLELEKVRLELEYMSV